MSPLIVTGPDGDLEFLTGSAGGSRITTATVQNVIHAIDGKQPAQVALAQPRLHDQLIPYSSYFESGLKNEDGSDVEPYDHSIVGFLASLGHNVTWVTPGQSTAQAIGWNGEKFDAGSEPRQHDSGYALWP